VLPPRPPTLCVKLRGEMKYGKPAMVIGALTILVSTLSFEWFTFSKTVLADQASPDDLIVGLIGLVIWLAGCVMICRTVSAPALFASGAALLFFLFFGGALLDHFSPDLTNIHIGMVGLMAPMAACFLGGVMFILVAIVRLVAN
jgi:hypothetical protein